MNTLLIIHNIGYGASAIAALIAFLFLILNNPRAKGHIPLALTSLAVAVFVASHVFGANAVNPETSRIFFMFNLSIFFIGAFNVHAVLSTLNKSKEKWYILVFLYSLAVISSIFFIVYPDLFLHASVPKMYFPNYYVPGIYNWIRLVFLYGICFMYFIYELFLSYKKEENIDIKRQLKYLIIAYGFAYILGFIPNFLIYDIQIDPLYGMMFMVIFAVIFIYAAVRYELMNIKVIAKQAFLYGTIVGSIGGIIVLFEYLNLIIASNYPSFPSWGIPALSVIFVMSVTFVVWKKIREVDLLKYEFITTITHKFRTPLTQIKWATDNLSSSNISSENKDQVEYIKSANGKLVDLTSLLVTVSGNEAATYEYHFEKVNLKNLIKDAPSFMETSIISKKIIIDGDYSLDLYAKCDESRIRFVIQTLIENATNYTPAGGTISIHLYEKDNKVFVSIKDSGIGISKNELPLLFSKFYRGNHARISDTEGMGIGLFLSKEIINRHNGKIWIESDGAGKGSTSTFSLPIAK